MRFGYTEIITQVSGIPIDDSHNTKTLEKNEAKLSVRCWYFLSWCHCEIIEHELECLLTRAGDSYSCLHY